MAINASLTGHLVFTTLHTNSVLDSLSRLMNMGVEPYLLTPALQLIIGQRLVRKVCPHC
ncbi:Flp pilus assembly complex ATPase component TadA [bacterium]|nr:Flp pilus assembly complex ATPase component TadA [bacterium]MBR4567139.1 Flp pilus assembly complex ATPase component TadA [bacterium]